MTERRLFRDRSESGRWRTNLVGLAVLVVALIGALLVSVTTAGSEGATALSGGSTVQDVGTLELFANDADGDGFQFVDDGGRTRATEIFTTNNRSKLTETDEDQNLVTLTPNDGATNQTYVGLKDHTFGVRDRGEGSGTPTAQINGSQRLTVDLLVGEDADLPGDGASYAELALKFKFGATVSILPLDATGEPVLEDPMEVTFTCDGGGASDCGSDSGADRDVVRVPEEGTDPSRPFTSVVISILDPSDGAVSLIDDPGFETFFNIVENVSVDLSISKTVDDDPVAEGDTVVYSVEVSNLSGNADATGVSVTDNLPAGLTFDSSTSGCVEDPAGVLTCTLDDIPVGESASFDITATVDPVTPPSVTLTNTASVTASETDTDPTNNTSAPVSIVATPALACGDTIDQANEEGYASAFTRLNLLDNGLDGCQTEPRKPYFQEIVGETIEFEPQGVVDAIYRGELTFPAGSGGDFRPSLRYDGNGETDGISFADMRGCIPTLAPAPSDPLDPLTKLADEFGELPAGTYPDMPAGETACSVSVSSVIGGIEAWVIRVDYDPWFRR